MRNRDAQSGSAYIVVVIGLLVLSLLGLSLAFVTETEHLIGNNERTLERVLYAADAGINVAVAKALVLPDNRGLRLEIPDPQITQLDLPDPNVNTDFTQQNEVDVTPLRPLLIAPCNLCSVNWGEEYARIDHGVAALVTRMGWNGSGPRPSAPTPLARKTVSVMVDFQPWQTSVETFARATEVDASGIKF
jgi:hypothetical protein